MKSVIKLINQRDVMHSGKFDKSRNIAEFKKSKSQNNLYYQK